MTDDALSAPNQTVGPMMFEPAVDTTKLVCNMTLGQQFREMPAPVTFRIDAQNNHARLQNRSFSSSSTGLFWYCIGEKCDLS
jgi:hypothetical protein